MADVSITAANVTAFENVSPMEGVAGATITAGQALYRDAADNRMKLAQNDGTAAEAVAEGIALHAASAGQPIKFAPSGTLNIGGTVVVGTVYVLSANAGGIAPYDDLASDRYVTILGIATTAARLRLSIVASGVVVPGGG